MIRKWSYITQVQSYTTDSLRPQNSTTLRFILKIFRKNTRFKGYTQGNTLFTRKLVILRQRKLNIKSYFIVSSLWAKFFLLTKKFINFTQSKFLFKYSVTYPDFKFFNQKSYLSSVGNGQHSLNIIFPKKNLQYFVDKTIPLRKQSQKQILNPNIFFTNTSSIHQLKFLGFNLIHSDYLQHHFPLTNTHVMKQVSFTMSTNFSLKITNLLTLSTRLIHLYLIIFLKFCKV
jgi:hypothetical protein